MSANSTQRLVVEPTSIAAAKNAFSEALDGVHTQLRRISSAHQTPWAGDPVSSETAVAFNNRTTGGDEEFNAENVLRAYAAQLQNAVDSLSKAEESYRIAEGNNSALWGQAG
ncbi:MAG: hypothetical protein ACRDRL_07695 [Sciscionella sp.]